MKEKKNLKTAASIALLTIVLLASFGENAYSKSSNVGQNPENQTVTWFEGDVQHWAYQSGDEFAVLATPGKQMNRQTQSIATAFPRGTVVNGPKDGLAIYRLEEPMDRTSLNTQIRSLAKPQGVQSISPVFYGSDTKEQGTRLILTGEIIVRFPEKWSVAKIAGLEKTYGVVRVKKLPFKPNTFIYQVPDALASLETANRIHVDGNAIYAYPNWLRSLVKKYMPNDTLFNNQWHLQNTGQEGGLAGQDINITSAWDNYMGSSNEVIAIVDDGLETGHEDLAANIVPGLGYDFTDRDNDPTPTTVDDNHGTACAGVAAARGDNSTGVSGAAPNAGLVGFRLLGRETDANVADALTRSGDIVDIYSNSWGPPDIGLLSGPGPLTRDALAFGVTHGRNGLGSIYTWAGGNGGDLGEDANSDGFANTRYSIAVAATTDMGVQAFYSEPGANILVNAPSSDGFASGITTTDRMGAFGYESPPGNYTSGFGGTSSATPVVSGVIALMLEANPDLTWRDVQHILISTATQNDPTDADWTVNGAPEAYPINHKYGFGRIDAFAAVTAAVNWPTAGPELMTPLVSSAPNLPIPDNDTTGVSDTIHVPYSIDIETAEVCFTSSDHTYWTDLDIRLTAPSGTVSRLARNKLIRGNIRDRYLDWCFTSVRHFGEEGQGDWTLQVSDRYPADTGTFETWSLRLYGTQENVAQIDASAGAGGRIAPEGTVLVGQGWDQEFTFTPEAGYRVADVIIDGASVGAMTTYTFSNVTAAHTVAVSFGQSGGDGDGGGGGGGCFIISAAQESDPTGPKGR